MRTLTMVVCVLGVAALALGQDLVDNPAYKAWSAFKPGTMVKHEATTVVKVEGKEMTTKMTTTTTLKEVTPEKAVVEIAMEMSMGDQKMPAQTTKQEIKAKVEQTTTQPTNMEKKGEGDEELEVAGKKYKAHWVEYVMKVGEAKTTSKVWQVKEIPGGTGKMESTTEGGQASPKTTMKVVEFKVVE